MRSAGEGNQLAKPPYGWLLTTTEAMRAPVWRNYMKQIREERVAHSRISLALQSALRPPMLRLLMRFGWPARH